MIPKLSMKEKLDRAMNHSGMKKQPTVSMSKSLQRAGISNFMNKTLSQYNPLRGSQIEFLGKNNIVKKDGIGLTANQSFI